MAITLEKFDVRAEVSTGGDNTEWQTLGENLSDLSSAPENALRYRVLAHYAGTDMMAMGDFAEMPGDLTALNAKFEAIAPGINALRVKGNPHRLE